MNGKIALIRADGSKQIGMGHLYRAALLAGMLRQRFGFEPKIIIRDNAVANEFLESRKLKVESIGSRLSISSEIDILNKMIERDKPSLIIFDLLIQEENHDYLPAIEHRGSLLIAITDDSNYRELAADLVINGNPNQIGNDYSEKSGHYLIGPKYFLMDPENGRINIKRPDGKANDILLTFGGSDINNLAYKSLAALEMIVQRSSLKIVLVVSSVCGYLEDLKDRINRSNLTIELLVDIDGFAPLWQKVDLAITAGGNTLFERIASRMPGATICQLERQMEIADKFSVLGVNINLGFGPELSETQLANRLEAFIIDRRTHIKQYERAPEVTDGQGLNRFGDELERLL